MGIPASFYALDGQYEDRSVKVDDPKVAVVDAYGMITGVSVGTVKITATTENKKKAVITVTVEEAPSKPISQVGPGGMVWLKGN